MKRCWNVFRSGNEIRVTYDDGTFGLFNIDHPLVIDRHGQRGRCIALHLLPLDIVLCNSTSTSTPDIHRMMEMGALGAYATFSNKLENSKKIEKPKPKAIPFHEFEAKVKALASKGVSDVSG